jgi:H+/Cl- antiporter ClcA
MRSRRRAGLLPVVTVVGIIFLRTHPVESFSSHSYSSRIKAISKQQLSRSRDVYRSQQLRLQASSSGTNGEEPSKKVGTPAKLNGGQSSTVVTTSSSRNGEESSTVEMSSPGPNGKESCPVVTISSSFNATEISPPVERNEKERSSSVATVFPVHKGPNPQHALKVLDTKSTSQLPKGEPRFVTGDIAPAPVDFDAAYVFFASAIIGVLSGFTVAIFKLSIEALRALMYGTPLGEYFPICLVPALGGLGVAVLAAFGDFSPGLRGTAKEIDAMSINSKRDERFKNGSALLRKPFAAIFTLGTGNSLGPEGPSVEIGMLMSRFCMPSSLVRSETDDEVVARIQRNRLLLCSGAAAGVAAGFNAPLAGVFFALEIMQQSLPPLAPRGGGTAATEVASSESPSVPVENTWFLQDKETDFLSSGTGGITAVLLASVLSALVSQIYLGDSLALGVPSYELKEPLVELPMYLLLGVISGVVAGCFSALAQLSKGFFDGKVGPSVVQDAMTTLPKWTKPAIGGLVCGVVGIAFPQILFFGYETLNTLLARTSYLPTQTVFSLVIVKVFTTAVAAGSGLVGGTFAPALFLGGMVGACFHDIVAQIFLLTHESPFQLADIQAYAIVGSAGVLSALFRAPLTASLLLFELTRDYEVLLPVLASAGVGSIVGDIVGKALEEVRRDRDSVSWGDLADNADKNEKI